MVFKTNKLFSGTLMCVLFWLGPTLVKGQGYHFYDFNHYEPEFLYDVGLHLGVMNCVTDLGGNRHGTQSITAYTAKSSQISGGISFTGTYKDFLALRLEGNIGRIAQYDSTLSNATHFSAKGRYERNLHFRSPVYDVFAALEVHPLYFFDNQANDGNPRRLSPYISLGIGIMGFNPQAEYQGEWIDLHPLRLEGQGFAEYPDHKPYNKSAIIYPTGIGFRYEVNRSFYFRVELTHRFTSTDYLDDVHNANWVNPALFFNYLPSDQAIIASELYNRSVLINPPRNTRPRGNPNDNDTYWSTSFKIGTIINRKSTVYKGYKRGIKCPKP